VRAHPLMYHRIYYMNPDLFRNTWPLISGRIYVCGIDLASIVYIIHKPGGLPVNFWLFSADES
jgi:hypothetical protein